ncbi:MAG: hypothetical protein BWX88_04856 [Planctomycetes bacterium ADurb.Bin126]|nr:MAG: hypothetical protein BWX88_04856 [Planctomycetes bacterium ADurb.Bin126]HOD83829.1 hypothetical protein [Phycisphaerae bacterium]HQL74314.1 hypothetical protein [Phycisphaerae bacterium]
MKRLVLYPFFLAAAPVLALYADNVQELLPGDLVRPLAAALLLAALAMLATWPLVKKLGKTGLPALCALGFVFAFGPAVSLMPSVRMRFFLPAWGLLWGGGYVFAVIRLRRTTRSLAGLTGALNLLAAGVALAPLLMRAPQLFQPPPAVSGPTAALAPTTVPAGASLPDVYYIILDAYSRQDVLASRFGFDNSPFVNALRERGFFVGDRGHANYMHTHLSLSATLNMEYLDEYLKRLGPVGESQEGWRQASQFFQPAITNCRVRRELEARGYRTVGLGTAYNITRGFNARAGWLSTGLTEFEMVLLRQSVLAVVMERVSVDLAPHDLHRDRVKYVLSHLPRVARQEGRKFVVAHLVCPHRPFVFYADGSDRPADDRFSNLLWWEEALEVDGYEDWYREAYPEQIEGLNHLVLDAVDGILAGSQHPPVIIIQGDHGSALGLRVDPNQCDVTARLGVLNAIYLPGVDPASLDPAMSSVNTFRVVFSRCFGMDLPSLENKAYHSGMGLTLTDVTQRVLAGTAGQEPPAP